MRTVIEYTSSNAFPDYFYWEGNVPFLFVRGTLLSLPNRPATRVTDVRLTLNDDGTFRQYVSTGLVNIHDDSI